MMLQPTPLNSGSAGAGSPVATPTAAAAAAVHAGPGVGSPRVGDHGPAPLVSPTQAARHLVEVVNGHGEDGGSQGSGGPSHDLWSSSELPLRLAPGLLVNPVPHPASPSASSSSSAVAAPTGATALVVRGSNLTSTTSPTVRSVGGSVGAPSLSPSSTGKAPAPLVAGSGHAGVLVSPVLGPRQPGDGTSMGRLGSPAVAASSSSPGSEDLEFLALNRLPRPPALTRCAKVYRSVEVSCGRAVPRVLIDGVPPELLSPAARHRVAEMEGYLWKKGRGKSSLGRRNWNRRYFVLQKSVLTYYRNSYSVPKKPKGSLYVYGAQMRVVPVVGDAMWRFDIMVPGDHSNVFHLRAESNAALDSWLATLQGSGCTLVRPSLTH